MFHATFFQFSVQRKVINWHSDIFLEEEFLPDPSNCYRSHNVGRLIVTIKFMEFEKEDERTKINRCPTVRA